MSAAGDNTTSHIPLTDEQLLNEQSRSSGSVIQEEQPSTSQQERSSSQDRQDLSQCEIILLVLVFHYAHWLVVQITKNISLLDHIISICSTSILCSLITISILLLDRIIRISSTSIMCSLITISILLLDHIISISSSCYNVLTGSAHGTEFTPSF